MLSWIFSTPRKVTQYLSPRTGLKIQDLLSILNLQDQDLSTPAWLFKQVIHVVCQALNPDGCLIWLYEDPWHPGSSTPLWLGPGPQPNLFLADYGPCPPAGVLLLSQLRDDHLRLVLLKAGMRLATPLIHQDELLGWLAVGPSRGNWRYSPEEQQFLELLAYQTATTLKTVQLQSKLETSVTQLRLAYQQVIQVQENEQRHLAETLHDETLQHLADVAVRLGLLLTQPKISGAALADLQTRLAQADCRLREIVRGVHPAVLTDLGLVEAVIAFLETTTSKPSAWPVLGQLGVTGFGDRRLPDQALELVLYRFVQNATVNALTHGQPDHLTIELRWHSASVEVRIKDDGCGMGITLEEAVRAGHFGLLTMRERIKAMGGDFRLISGPGQGTEVFGCVPLTTPSPAPDHVDRYTFELRGASL